MLITCLLVAVLLEEALSRVEHRACVVLDREHTVAALRRHEIHMTSKIRYELVNECVICKEEKEDVER